MEEKNEHDFDESEWQASGAGGPSFNFEEAQGEPDFEPRDADQKGADSGQFASSWRSAEPPPKSGRGAARPSGARRPDQVNSEERKWATVAHAVGAVSVLATAGGLIPLMIWLLRKDQGSFAADEAKEALNFHITMWILLLVSFPTLCWAPITFIVVSAIVILSVVTSILGALSAYSGEGYRYPLNFRLIS